MIIFVASQAEPVTDPYLIDRCSILCEGMNCKFGLVLNKTDLNPADNLFESYSNTGYPVFRISAVTGEGIDTLVSYISGMTVCFTGNSGVGKSSILNYINPDFSIETDEVSTKLHRGKHTTRHIELFKLSDSTFIADTPGFASYDDSFFISLDKYHLASLFKEFNSYASYCAYDDCLHRDEPGCEIQKALTENKITLSRYNSYIRLLDLIENNPNFKVNKFNY